MIAAGKTRRTVLRTAAGTGAVALLAPMRLLEPSTADAIETVSPQEKCLLDNYTTVYNDLKSCTQNPLDKLDGLTESIASDENYLRNQKKPAARKRLKKAIARAIRERAQAQREVDFCNALFLEDRAKGEAKCIAPSPPGGGSGGSGTGGSAGCEPGYLLCNDYCCDTNIAYCQGCKGNVICCRIEGNCCPSSA